MITMKMAKDDVVEVGNTGLCNELNEQLMVSSITRIDEYGRPFWGDDKA